MGRRNEDNPPKVPHQDPSGCDRGGQVTRSESDWGARHAGAQLPSHGCRFKHNKDANTITVDKWFGKKKELSVIKTVLSHIENLFTGVTKGFKYKVKLVFAHFPVNVGVADSGDHITVMNFIGQKVKFEVDALPGCKIVKDPKNQTEFHVEGNDIENVSRTCALISQSCKVRNKDIRKFLDGIYVCEKTNVVVEEE